MMRKLLIPLLLSCWLLPVQAEPLAFVVAKPHAVDVLFSAEATVEPVASAELAVQVSGRVLEVRVDAGQVVQKGDLLMRIDARESAEAAAAAAARYANAKAVFARTEQLVAQKFVSPAALDKARADLNAATAERDAAGVAQGHARIVAPISGVVARRLVEVGEMAAPGKPLLTIFAPGDLRVTAQVPQLRLKEIAAAQSAAVELPGVPDWLTSRQITVLPTVDASTRVSEVRVSLPTSADLPAKLTPGMFARVHFVLGQAERLTVPAAAVVRRGEITAVYVLPAEGRPLLRQLRLGETVGKNEIEVLAGLQAGERVALDPVKAGIALKAAR